MLFALSEHRAVPAELVGRIALLVGAQNVAATICAFGLAERPR